MRFDGKDNPQVAKKISIGELSGVTVPAVQGSVATMRKYAAPDARSEFSDMVKSTFLEVLTDNAEKKPILEQLNEHECALWEANRDADNAEQVKQNIREYAMSLVTMAKLSASDYAYAPDPEKKSTWKLPIDTKEHVSAAAQALSPSGFRGNMVEIPEADRDAVVSRVRAAWLKFHPDSELPESLRKTDMNTEELQALAEMNDVQKAHYKSLKSDEDKQAFIKMSPADRDATVEVLKQADEEYVTCDGTVLKKSAVGSDVFAMLKKQDAQIVKMQNAQETERFIKVANDDTHKHLPGEAMAKAVALRAIDGLDATVKATIEQMLSAGNAALGQEFTIKASGHTHMSSGAGKLEKMAKEHAEKHSVSMAKAYEAVMATPEGQALYEEEQQ